ncbi:MAG: beta-ketoacyl-[acyl-carrier-protein] synthase family protein [Desulfonatronovibrio sp.]
MYQVAITGVGIISSLGNDAGTVTNALYQGKSGIEVDPKRLELGFQSPLTGVIRNFDPVRYLGRKQRKTMPDFAVWAHAAVMEALGMAGMEPEALRNEHTGLIFGCDSSCLAGVDQVDRLREYQDSRSIGSGHIFRSMTSTITMNLNTLLGTRGACWSISSACSSGGHAIGQAADLIALGRQERMICGGAQEVNWQSMCSFDGLGAFSARIDNPAKASRPFDAGRDGLVPSGGSAALILERYDLARKRGAKILGRIKGYGFSSDGRHISVPSPDGIEQAMRSALKGAGLIPSDIDYVCAHATSTPAGDSVEAESICRVFGRSTPPVSSVKSMTGHELWMSGAAQVVYSVLMAQNDFIAPNINFEGPDKASALLDIVTEARSAGLVHILCNSAGFGGTNACIALGFK